MTGLDPILVERYSKQFDRLFDLLEAASCTLIPDAFEMQVQSIERAKQIVNEQKAAFDSILNSLSIGVLFQEGVSFVVQNAEMDANRSCIGLLWSALDIISDIIVFRSDFADFMESLSLDSPVARNLTDFVLVESQVDSLCDSLNTVSDLIISVISSLDN